MSIVAFNVTEFLLVTRAFIPNVTIIFLHTPFHLLAK